MPKSIGKSLGTFLNATQIAQDLGLSRSGIFNLIRSGNFPKGIKMGNSLRWEYEDVRAWIDARKGMKA